MVTLRKVGLHKTSSIEVDLTRYTNRFPLSQKEEGQFWEGGVGGRVMCLPECAVCVSVMYVDVGVICISRYCVLCMCSVMCGNGKVPNMKFFTIRNDIEILSTDMNQPTSDPKFKKTGR